MWTYLVTLFSHEILSKIRRGYFWTTGASLYVNYHLSPNTDVFDFTVGNERNISIRTTFNHSTKKGTSTACIVTQHKSTSNAANIKS